MHPLIETWEINQKINELLIRDLKDAVLKDLPVSKGRTVGQQLAHIHNVRQMWLKASAPEMMGTLRKLEKEEQLTSSILIGHLRESATGISKLILMGIEQGKIKGFKPHPEAFVGYLIAHEAHHRGQVILTLKENGHLPDKKILFGLWEWGNKG